MRRKRATNNRSKGNTGGGDNDDDDNNSNNNNNSQDIEDGHAGDDSYSSFHESSEVGSQNNGNGGGGGGGGGTLVDKDDKKKKFAAEVRQVQKIASREQNCMQIFKCMGLFISIMAAILVSTGTYVILTNEETVDYVEHFQLFCDTIQDAAQFHAKNMFLAMDICGQAITSAAIATNATFPFVTVPNFEVLGAATRAQSGIEMLFWQPILVNDKKKQKWIEYSLQNQGWVNESRALAMKHAQQQQQDGSIVTYSPSNYIYNSIPDFIWDRAENLTVRPTVAPPPYIPVWQVSPPPFHPGFVNFNLPTFPGNKDQLEATYINRAPIIAKAIDLPRLGLVAQNPTDHDAYHSLLVDWNKQQQQQPVDNKNGSSSSSSAFDTPHSLFTQPIFEELYNASSEIVGFVMGVVPWDMYMTNLLPSGIEGITCVLENSCGQAFTYQLHGNRAVYVGEGDLHDTKYTEMRVVVPFEAPQPKGFSNTSSSSSSNSTMSNQQPVVDGKNNKTDGEDSNGKVGSCHYQFALYPTQEFEASYHTNIPQVMTITVACIFSAMAVTFILYDFMVYRRNSKILKIAARSGAIVSSLFPSTVRDRLFAAKEEEKNNKVGNSDHDKAAVNGDTKTSLKAFMSEDDTAGRRDSLSMDEVFKKGGRAPSVGGGGGGLNGSGGGYSSGDDDGDDNYILKTKPIADLFPATTIMFADISGFTLWSSSRDPEAVFTLLETLYRSFDAIAKKRRVYKVETIGDCYVAVTGLPEPRENHALVMAQFASEIRKRFNFLIHKKLVPVLGADTGRLCLRAGLHSGPVTAGVLRGENARFQLFGDTMNTASRMESNGKPDLIQVSQETADLIICGGKPHWVTPREDKIQAKGKGELQTFWLDLQRKNKNTTYAESNASSFDASSMDDDSPLPKRSTGTATSNEDNNGHGPLSPSSFHDDSSTVNDSPQDQAVTLSSLLHHHESSDHDDDLSRSLSQPLHPPTEKQQQQKQQQQQQHLHDSSNIEYYGYEDHNDDSNNTQDTEKILVQEARKLSLTEGGTGSERQIMLRKNSLLAC